LLPAADFVAGERPPKSGENSPAPTFRHLQTFADILDAPAPMM
jgi:hypothetical protein